VHRPLPVQVHSDVFVDVQRKLSSAEQKAKTLEADLANAAEELSERLKAHAEK
jgi:hypothetical protein